MSAWNAITAAEVLEEFSATEHEGLKAAAGDVDQLPAILGRVVGEVRAVIANSGGAVADGLTIPDSLRPDVIAIARWRWLTGFPALKDMATKERQEAYERGQKHLDEINARTRAVEAPEASTNSQAGNWGSETKIDMRTHS